MRHPRFAHIHASGRFDATLDETQEAWDKFRAKVGVRLITGTEHGTGDHDPAFSNEDWDHYRGGECVAAWRTDTFQLAWAPSFDRIGTAFYRGGNRDARTPLLTVPLKHLITGRVVMVRVSHMPAHVQDGDKFRRTTTRVIAQGVAWSTSLATLGRRSTRFKRNNPHAALIDAADFNVDLHRKHWRALIRTTLGLRCADGRTLPKTGDMGKRLISWFYVHGLNVAASDVLPKNEGFDHRPVIVQFTIAPKEHR